MDDLADVSCRKLGNLGRIQAHGTAMLVLQEDAVGRKTNKRNHCNPKFCNPLCVVPWFQWKKEVVQLFNVTTAKRPKIRIGEESSVKGPRNNKSAMAHGGLGYLVQLAAFFIIKRRFFS